MDLFSGIGGITIALKEWVKPIAYCEIERYAQSVLLQRMADNDLPRAPIWDDITSLKGTMLPEIDIIYGGFPCQDLSVCGNGAGLEGKRSGLFFEIIRLVSEIRPSFVFLENVPAVTVRDLRQILLEFTKIGYDCRWTIVSAAAIGAVHIRERWFLLAHADGERLREECGKENPNKSEAAGKIFPDHIGFERRDPKSSARMLKPRVDRTGDGISYKVDRNRALGNAVVPAQAREAFKRLMEL